MAELENELRSALMAQSPAEFAAQDRVARSADFMAETDEGRAALQAWPTTTSSCSRCSSTALVKPAARRLARRPFR
jgi:hypothetical protein